MCAFNSCSTPILIVWILVIFGLISKVDTIYVELGCPVNFKEGSNSITCTVNQALLSSKCSRALSVIYFIYIKPDQTQTQVNECETPNFQTSNICPSTVSTGKKSNSTCQCEEISGNLVKYQLNFQANKTLHEGITWICNVCSSQNPVDENFQSCSNIKFDTDGNGSSSDFPPWAIALIVIFVVGIIVTTVAVAIYVSKHGKKG